MVQLAWRSVKQQNVHHRGVLLLSSRNVVAAKVVHGHKDEMVRATEEAKASVWRVGLVPPPAWGVKVAPRVDVPAELDGRTLTAV